MTRPLIVPPRRYVMETTDPEQAVAFFESAVSTTVRSAEIAEANSLRYSRTDAGLFSLDEVRLPLSYSFEVEPVGKLNISHRVSGTGERHTYGASDRYGPGDVYIAAHPDQAYTGVNESAAPHSVLELAYLDLALLDRVAATDPARRHGSVRFTSLAPVSPAAAALWKATRGHVAGLLADPQAAQPLLIGNVARLLATVAIATFPNDALISPTITDRHDASKVAARRATAFIEEHADEDIAVTDIAAAVHVSIRAVQLAFRRHLGTTPMAYLRRVRLDRARRELLAADPGRTSVAVVAYRWGFSSPGRFAAYYRKNYGVLPSQTLRS